MTPDGSITMSCPPKASPLHPPLRSTHASSARSTDQPYWTHPFYGPSGLIHGQHFRVRFRRAKRSVPLAAAIVVARVTDAHESDERSLDPRALLCDSSRPAAERMSSSGARIEGPDGGGSARQPRALTPPHHYSQVTVRDLRRHFAAITRRRRHRGTGRIICARFGPKGRIDPSRGHSPDRRRQMDSAPHGPTKPTCRCDEEHRLAGRRPIHGSTTGACTTLGGASRRSADESARMLGEVQIGA